MAHIIEVERYSEAEAHSFLDALFYSDSVSAIGYRSFNGGFLAGAINRDADAESELDERISEMMMDELCTIFPE